MSDTPRTDAELQKNEGGSISFIFARQLERELAAAIAERDEARRERDYYNANFQGCQIARIRDNAQLIAERDAARECLREAIKEVETEPIWSSLIRDTLNRWRAAAGLEQK